MRDEPLDAELVMRLAGLAGLSVEHAQAERLAPLLATLHGQAEALCALDLDGVVPCCVLHLEAR